MWAPAQRPDPPKKDLVPLLPVRWGAQQIQSRPGRFSADTRESRSGRFSADTPIDRSHFAHRSGSVWLVDWRFPPTSGGHPPGFYPLRRGWLLPGAWGAPIKWNADVAVGIFLKCRARVCTGPAPGSTQKRPCASLANSVGCATNTV